ncbi:hypothetical protein [Marinoscillum sp.]|uniref:hypothetical protein n=1 Tax=Marinoscillum sp. TaxID=2024838 RepID=UPI003BAA5567
MTERILLIFFVFFLSYRGTSQDFSAEIRADKLTIDGKARDGISTSFDFPAREVERGWWRYSREFGRPLNMRGYYKVTIPSEVNSGNVDITLLSKTLSSKTGCKFFLVLDQEHVPVTKVAAYNAQIKTILQDFKKTYYIDELGETLEKAEKKAASASKKVSKSDGNGKEKALAELTGYQKQIEAIKNQLKIIYQAY